MKLIFISTDVIHSRIKPLPINRFRGILGDEKEFHKSLFQSQRVENMRETVGVIPRGRKERNIVLHKESIKKKN